VAQSAKPDTNRVRSLPQSELNGNAGNGCGVGARERPPVLAWQYLVGRRRGRGERLESRGTKGT